MVIFFEVEVYILAYFAKVKSSFWQHNPDSEERLPLAQKLIPVITTGQVADAIVNGIIKRKKKISAPYYAYNH